MSRPKGPPSAPGAPNDRLTDDALTADFRIYQRARGHRYALDDVLTAAEAVRAGSPCEASGGALGPRRILDLGCGVGSVLLMLAWRFPSSTLVGVEAQSQSFELACRNVSRNRVDDRVEVVHGDLRNERIVPPLGSFDLVSGTPPYFPLAAGTASPDPQRAAARFELRGSVWDYLTAAVGAARVGGRIVLCGAPTGAKRVRAVTKGRPIQLLRQLAAVPREGRSPLFFVWTWKRLAEPPVSQAPIEESTFVARASSGERTPGYRDLRALFGFEPSKG